MDILALQSHGAYSGTSKTELQVSDGGDWFPLVGVTSHEFFDRRVNWATLSHFELLGNGVHGTVYKVLDTRLQRLVALKILHSALNDGARQLFLMEAVALVLLKHPNILEVYDAYQAETFVYQTFEYVEGRTLGQIMADDKPLDPAYAIEIVRQVGAGFEYAHLHGVIHRDVKPSNILISNDGRVLLADFGLAIAPGAPTLTQSGTIAGTPAYMSPEQVMGKPVDGRSDIFSLGVVFYELLTGRKPFSAESTAKLFSKVVEEEPASPRQLDPSVPASINETVLKSLAKEPGQGSRPQTISSERWPEAIHVFGSKKQMKRSHWEVNRRISVKSSRIAVTRLG